MRALYTTTILLGSLLLFLIQPLIAKMILPYFGGTPGVWNTSLVFFQTALLAGYAYAHFGPKWLGHRTHMVVHLILFSVSVFALPFSVQVGFNPAKSFLPEWLILLAFLTTTVGLPYFVVSAGAPLLQRWFSRTNDSAARDPYFLYAASNLGSVVALIGYPLWFEGTFPLPQQSQIWSWAFGGLGLCLLACAVIAFRLRPAEEPIETPDEPITSKQRWRWLILAAVPSSLLMGVTTYLTTNLASIPMLWVIPLTLYLVTFIVAFKSKPVFVSSKLARWGALLLAPMCLMMVLEATEPFWALALFHVVVFFLAGLICNGELAETRPSAKHLTEFYLWMSVGGVVGGVFNAIVAPMVFQSLAEYPIALVALLLLRWKPVDRPFKRIDVFWPITVAAVTIAIWFGAKAAGIPAGQLRTAITMGIPALLCFVSIDSPLRYALSIGAFLLMARYLGFSTGGRMIHSDRSFFGLHRILDHTNGNYRNLVHGNTIHGRQNLTPEKRLIPTTYYYPSGPIGQVMEAYLPLLKPAHVGLVGLGVGSLASYGRVGDQFTFFEIDPVVIELASDPKFFTYVSECKADLKIIEGDARLSLQDVSKDSLDILVIDAFSSDSIPLHLITIEAIQLYMARLKQDGVLAFHISNRYLDLAPVLAGAAKDLGLTVRYQEDFAVTDEERADGKLTSLYFLMGRSEATFAPLGKAVRWDQLDQIRQLRPWTDERSNILEVWGSD